MSDDLRAWIDYLHAAASVPPGSEDYEEAQQAVEEAMLKIRSMNRMANAQEQVELANDGPDAVATASGSALEDIGGQAGGTAGQLLGGMGAGGNPVLSQILGSLGGALGQKLGASFATGGSPELLEDAQGQHPTAGVIGGTLPGALGLALGGAMGVSRLRQVGGKTSFGQGKALVHGLRNIGKRTEAEQMGASQFGGPAVRTKPQARPPQPKPAVDEMPVPTYQRRAAEAEAGAQRTHPTIPEMQGDVRPRHLTPPQEPPDPRIGTAAPGGGRYVAPGPHQKAGPKVRVQSPKMPSEMAPKQLQVLKQYLEGATPEQIPERLEAMRALGMDIPAGMESELTSAMRVAASSSSGAKLSVRGTQYRGKPGFSVIGTDSRGRRVKIFAESRDAAERIRAKVAAGEEVGTEDFNP